MNPARLTLSTLLRSGAALAALGLIGLGVFDVGFSSATPFLYGGPGPWITAPRRVDTQLTWVDPSHPPQHVFVRRFDAKEGESGHVEIRALRRFNVDLNGQSLGGQSDATAWRQIWRADFVDALRTGRNELRVVVENPNGPPVLQASVELPGRRLATDHLWRVSTPTQNPRPAMLATDTGPHPDSFALPEPGQVLRSHAVPLGLGVAACFAFVLMADQRRLPWLERHAVATAGAVATAFWLLFVIAKAVGLPVVMGFDAPAHLHYIELIRSSGALPLADAGFANYHPPLFHGLTAGLTGMLGVSPTDASAQFFYRVIPLLAGFACVALAALTARRLWPGDSAGDDLRVAVATIFGAIVPVNVYMAGYLGNESLHAAWVSASTFMATKILLDERARTRDIAWLALFLTLGLLTKFTSLALAPLIMGFVLIKLLWIEERPTLEVTRLAALVIVAMSLGSGWFYLRNWIEFGDPVVWNLDLPGAPTWWLQPGYHTPSYYLGFGEGIRHPIFAGFNSFWDGVYSTFWGDGMVAGMASFHTRHGAFNDEFMLVGYWLALPALIPLASGAWRALRCAVGNQVEPGRDELARTLLLALLFLMAASMLLITLRLPFYAQAKASYLLPAFVPLVILLTDGLVSLHERLRGPRRRIVRLGLWTWAVSLVVVLMASFLA